MSKIGMLREVLYELLKEHEREGTIPTNGRFLFYELVQRGIISKQHTGARRPDQDMNEALVDLRKSGRIPWDWIVDETRELDDYRGSSSIKDGVLKRLAAIRIDPWNGQEPLILTESRSLAGVLRSIAWEYRTRLAPTNGQCCGFLHTDIAPFLLEDHRILYLGDFDLAGNDIEANTRSVLEREVTARHTLQFLKWERLALTEAQVVEYDLPRIIKGDRRFKDGGAHEAVETEALSQRVIVDILRTRLEELLPEPLERVHERAEAQRTIVRRVLARIS